MDLEFVNLARRIPHELKLRGGTTKWILKRALGPLLPREIIERPKKGFGMPIGRWLREGQFELKPCCPVPGYDSNLAKRKYAAHVSGASDERLFLWSSWLLQRWMER